MKSQCVFVCVIQPASPHTPAFTPSLSTHGRRTGWRPISVPDGSTLTNQLDPTSSPGNWDYRPICLPPPPPWGTLSTTPPSLLALITPPIPRKLSPSKEGKVGGKKTKKLAAHESASINMDDFYVNAERTREQRRQQLDFVCVCVCVYKLSQRRFATR